MATSSLVSMKVPEAGDYARRQRASVPWRRDGSRACAALWVSCSSTCVLYCPWVFLIPLIFFHLWYFNKKKSLNWWDWTGKTESLIQLRFVGLLLSGKPGAGPKNEVNKINPCPQRTFRSAGRIVGPAKYILYSSVHFWESTEKDSVNSREKARKGPLRRRAEVWPPSETKQKSHEAGIQLCTHPTIC